MSEEFEQALKMIQDQGITIGKLQADLQQEKDRLKLSRASSANQYNKRQEIKAELDKANEKIKEYEVTLQKINKWAWKQFNDYIGSGRNYEASVIKNLIDRKFGEENDDESKA